MASGFGNTVRYTVFGSSHGPEIGIEIEGLPAGERVDLDALSAFLERRAPGRSPLTSARREPDLPQFFSGLQDGVTTGETLRAVIKNKDTRPADYTGFFDTPRPSHADYTARLRYEDAVDLRGGGAFSGRMTAPLCVGGGIAKQILSRRGVEIGAHLQQVGSAEDARFPLLPDKALFDSVASKPIPVIDDAAGERMRREIEAAKAEQDSVGASVECAVIGLPAGLGGPLFDGVEGRLARALFGIPAVKGLEFGAGFAAASMRGSVHNDPFVVSDGRILTEKNDHGGILGGITSGMPLVFRAAIKPTPSIGLPQRTVNLRAMEPAEITVRGRHDPCIGLRAVPVVEAVTAAALLDLLLDTEA